MRTRLLMFLVGSLLWALWHIDAAATAPQSSERPNPWRRTVDGWEHIARWSPIQTTFQPQLHPAVVSAFVLLSSIGVLVAYPSNGVRRW